MALPVLLVVLAWLWHAGLRMVAVVLAANAVCAVAATILLKLISRQTGGAFFGTWWYLTRGAPSGHAAVSTAIYGGIGVLFALRARGVARVSGVALALGLMLGVDVTRVTLGFHSLGDVATGLALGGVFAGMTLVAADRSPRKWPPMLALLLGLAVTATIMHLTGVRFSSSAIL